MVLAILNNRGLIYANFCAQGSLVKIIYMLEDLYKLLVNLKQKKPIMAPGEGVFDCDDALVHTAAVVHTWIATRWLPMIVKRSFMLDINTS
jgi:hypothetical protein